MMRCKVCNAKINIHQDRIIIQEDEYNYSVRPIRMVSIRYPNNIYKVELVCPLCGNLIAMREYND